MDTKITTIEYNCLLFWIKLYSYRTSEYGTQLEVVSHICRVTMTEHTAQNIPLSRKFKSWFCRIFETLCLALVLRFAYSNYPGAGRAIVFIKLNFCQIYTLELLANIGIFASQPRLTKWMIFFQRYILCISSSEFCTALNWSGLWFANKVRLEV